MPNQLIIIAALWLSYGFLRFIVETVYVSVAQGKFVERGFLTGPIIPIYAFGALLILFALEDFCDNLLVLYLAAVIFTSVLEYFGSYLMEKLFNLKLWDYSKRFMNINGRVCLLNSTLFGILSVVVIFYINPFLMSQLLSMNQRFLTALTVILLIVTALDFMFSVLATLNIRTQVALLADLKVKLSETKDAELAKHAQRYRFFKERLYRAFPNMQSKKIDNVIQELKDYYEQYKNH